MRHTRFVKYRKKIQKVTVFSETLKEDTDKWAYGLGRSEARARPETNMSRVRRVSPIGRRNTDSDRPSRLRTR